MLLSPKWQKMWMESQHSSKSIVNTPLPSQQAKKILEDLKTSCSSPNKAVQLEALRCWGTWINNQSADGWKQNLVCYTAVRPLLTKKLQPLHKDVDICKLKLSLLWRLIVKVQNIIQLEGPQYILEVFLQSCLVGLSSSDGIDNEISILIFQLLLAIFKKDESQNICDKESFSPLSTEILGSKKVFHIFADKFLNIFINWRKVKDKSIVLKIWKCFLEHCEQSCENIPIPIWHRIFKIVGQICTERSELVKERLAFLHGCATTLKSVLSSSKFIDYGNLLTTPCEALVKKLMELCSVECEEFCDVEMFVLSREMTQVLSDESVAIGGYDLCIFVLDLLEEFSSRSLFWGVWCGLVDCYKIRLKGIETNQFTKIQMKFYRKLRGVAVNYSLDKNYLHKDCLTEVERHIGSLNIDCLCKYEKVGGQEDGGVGPEFMEIGDDYPRIPNSENIVALTPKNGLGKFSTVTVFRKSNDRKTRIVLNFDLIKNVLISRDVHSLKSLVEGLCRFRFISFKNDQTEDLVSNHVRVEVEKKKITITGSKKKETPSICDAPPKPKPVAACRNENRIDKEEEVISSPKTRSQRRAEEESRREREESQKRKKRKSFEVLVQEIVRKNKLRKTEKNTRSKSPVGVMKKEKRNKKKPAEEEKIDTTKRQLRNSKKEEPKTQKERKKSGKKSTVGKLENYFQIVKKKTGSEKKEKEAAKEKKSKKEKKAKMKCCGSGKEETEKKETGWKQTSLKAIINKKNKAENLKHGMKTRNQNPAVVEELPKVTNQKKNLDGKSLAKLSPFKEVFHDHEYAKIEPSNLIALESIITGVGKKVEEKPESKVSSRKEELSSTGRSSLKQPKVKPLTEGKTKVKKVYKKRKEKSLEIEEPKETLPEVKQTKVKPKSLVRKHSREAKKEEHKPVEATPESKQPEGLVVSELQPKVKPQVEVVDKGGDEEKTEEKAQAPEEATTELEPPKSEIETIPAIPEVKEDERTIKEDSKSLPVENPKTELENTKDEEEAQEEIQKERKGMKRVRMIDSLKPSKKIKLDAEEMEIEEINSPLEVLEKENLGTPEENKSETAILTTENTFGEKVVSILKVKGDASPKTVNGTISSRALRIIALVPESTILGQVHRESSPKVDTLKSKKAPNVDKNSRASKMLALLSENIIRDPEDPTELEDLKSEEVYSYGTIQPATTSNIMTPTSTLKSPNAVKKRRSIRFDDAKNETVLYQTDTPPSQILEEKEKFRRIKLQEIAT